MRRVRPVGEPCLPLKFRFEDEAQTWRYAEPDWDELRRVVTGHGPKSQERLDFRRFNHEQTAWVRETILAPHVAAAA